MNWARLDGDFPQHPKVLPLSDAAVAAWLRGLCYCARWETDGLIPWGIVRSLSKPKPRAELIGAGLWVKQDDDGVMVHDYLEWNPPKAYLDALREKRSAAGRKGAAKRWQLP